MAEENYTPTVKLAIVTETFPPEINGVAMTFGVIARELGRRGHRVTVYRPRRRDLPAAESHPEFEVVPMPGMPIPGYPMLRLGLPAGRALRARWTAPASFHTNPRSWAPFFCAAVAAGRSGAYRNMEYDLGVRSRAIASLCFHLCDRFVTTA